MPTLTQRLWDDPPPSLAALRAAIRAEYQVPPHEGTLRFRDPNGDEVRVGVSWLAWHFWRHHPERLRWLPLVGPAVEQANRFTEELDRRGRPTGDGFYSSRIRVIDRRMTRPPESYLTYVGRHPDGNEWSSLYNVTEARRERREQAGRQLWPARPTTGRRNPVPAQPRAASTRPGRSTATRESTTPIGLWEVAAAAVALAALHDLAGRRAA